VTPAVADPRAVTPPVLKGRAFAERLAAVCQGPLPETPLADRKYRRVLIPGLVGGEIQVALLGLLGQALRMRGAEVTALMCDRFLPACTCRKADHHELACQRWCHTNAGPFVRALRLPYRWYSEFIAEAENAECRRIAQGVPSEQIPGFRFHDIGLGPHVVRSVESYFKVGECDLQRPDMVRAAREFLLAGMYLTIVGARALDELRIDKVFVDDGQKIDWGVVRAVAVNKGIPVDVLWHGHRAYSVRFERERPGQPPAHMPEWDVWRKLPLTAAQQADLDRYLAEHDCRPYEFRPDWRAQPTPAAEVRRLLGLPERRPGLVFGLFSNVGFDAGLTKHGAAYESMTAWLVDTVEHFRRWPQHHLVVKAHPAENYQRALDNVLELIRVRCAPVPPNVRLLPPDTPVTAQSVLRILDCALLYTSTVAIEAGVRGVPAILVGGGWNAGRGFTADAANPEDYVRRLERACAGRELPPTNVELARRFAYAMWFRAALVIRYFDVLNWNVRALKLRHWSELAAGCDPVIDTISCGVLNDAPFEAPV
jgi:hypothetical protein